MNTFCISISTIVEQDCRANMAATETSVAIFLVCLHLYLPICLVSCCVCKMLLVFVMLFSIAFISYPCTFIYLYLLFIY